MLFVIKYGGLRMISKQSFNEQIIDCKKHYHALTSHLFLQKYIEEPAVDEDKLRFLFAMLSDKVPKKDVHMFALAMMLVDTALQIHEQVSLHDVQSDYLRKNRQLTVLAGDFYSSLYYRLLSKDGHLSMIKVFSQSIQTINELKMTIYREKSFTFAEFKEYIAMIESALLQNIAKHFELPSWEKMIKEYFLLRRFAEEEQRTVVAANEKDVPASYVIFKQIQKLTGIHREKFVFLIQETMNESRDYLEGKLSEMTQLQSFIREYIEGKLPIPRSYREKIAEEG